jgi:hypothetical protein
MARVRVLLIYANTKKLLLFCSHFCVIPTGVRGAEGPGSSTFVIERRSDSYLARYFVWTGEMVNT